MHSTHFHFMHNVWQTPKTFIHSFIHLSRNANYCLRYLRWGNNVKNSNLYHRIRKGNKVETFLWRSNVHCTLCIIIYYMYHSIRRTIFSKKFYLSIIEKTIDYFNRWKLNWSPCINAQRSNCFKLVVVLLVFYVLLPLEYLEFFFHKNIKLTNSAENTDGMWSVKAVTALSQILNGIS